ncbi:DUF1840 domain-containing protein [Variovorax sp. VNK109]|uniref:DUF1840 domain-containing protein n=1 Tax=Variovorax sp. VNK109 TaxID=3400919 RepID=UPI003C106A6A
MLYKFKSRATSDLIMLEVNGRRVLEIIGKGTGPTGIITPEQMPAALSALEAAVKEDEAKPRAKDDVASDGDEDGKAKGDGVSLRQRVAPFADMLRQSQAAGKEVVWGV